jgi:hypothetical protein
MPATCLSSGRGTSPQTMIPYHTGRSSHRQTGTQTGVLSTRFPLRGRCGSHFIRICIRICFSLRVSRYYETDGISPRFLSNFMETA